MISTLVNYVIMVSITQNRDKISPKKLKYPKYNVYISISDMSSEIVIERVIVPLTKQKPLASLFFAWCRPPAQFTAMSHLSLLNRAAPSDHSKRQADQMHTSYYVDLRTHRPSS